MSRIKWFRSGSVLVLSLALPGPVAHAGGETEPSSAWIDYDGDGADDLVLVLPEVGVQLLRNAGEGRFEDVTALVGLTELAGSSELAWADFDGDSDVDLLAVMPSGELRLLTNQAGERFDRTEVGSGIESLAGVRSATWHDFDGDTLPDLLVRTAQSITLQRNLGEGRFEPMLLEAALSRETEVLQEAALTGARKSGETRPGRIELPAGPDDVGSLESPSASGFGAQPGARSGGSGSSGSSGSGSSGGGGGGGENNGGGNNGGGGGPGGGVPANTWSLFGNLLSNPAVDYLGTADSVPLSVRTNAVERMGIASSGEIDIHTPLTVGSTLEVTDDLTVLGRGRFQNATQSVSPASGALVVAGGVGVGADTNLGRDLGVARHAAIGGNTGVAGGLNVNGLARFTNTQPSNSAATGALVVTGGVGVGADANVGRDLDVGRNATVEGMSTLKGNVSMAADATVGRDLTVARDVNVTGDARFNGSIGVGSSSSSVQLNVTSPSTTDFPFLAEVSGTSNKFSMNDDGQLYVRSTKAGSASSSGNFAMHLDAQSQGLLIKLNATGFPGGANHYIDFWGSTNMRRGRIEGQTLSELQSSFDYIWTNAMAALEEAFVIAEGVACGIQLDAAEVVVMAAEGALVYAEWAEWIIDAEGSVGIAFESGSGDYAEWLEKADPDEGFSFGDVVGVRGGKISRDTRGADQLMVVSLAPIVLGNMPPQGEEENYEKVAFLGQVPVRVRGTARVGDYVLDSGRNDGTGYAVDPEDMSVEDYARAVGIAWSESRTDGVSYVRVAVGLKNGDLVRELVRQQQRIDLLEEKLQAVVAFVGMQGAGPAAAVPHAPPTASQPAAGEGDPLAQAEPRASQSEVLTRGLAARSRQLERLVEEKPDLLLEGLAHVRQRFVARGLDVEADPELRRLFDDPDYFLEQVRSMVR